MSHIRLKEISHLYDSTLITKVSVNDDGKGHRFWIHQDGQFKELVQRYICIINIDFYEIHKICSIYQPILGFGNKSLESCMCYRRKHFLEVYFYISQSMLKVTVT